MFSAQRYKIKVSPPRKHRMQCRFFKMHSEFCQVAATKKGRHTPENVPSQIHIVCLRLVRNVRSFEHLVARQIEVAVVRNGFHHTFRHSLQFAAFHQSIHISLKLVIHFLCQHIGFMTIVTHESSQLTEEAPAFKVREEVVACQTRCLANKVKYIGSAVIPSVCMTFAEMN